MATASSSAAFVRLGDFIGKETVEVIDGGTKDIILQNDRDVPVLVYIEERISKRLIQNSISCNYNPGVVFDIAAGTGHCLQITWNAGEGDSLRLGLPLKVKDGTRTMPMQINLIGSAKLGPVVKGVESSKRRRPLAPAPQPLAPAPQPLAPAPQPLPVARPSEQFQSASSVAVQRSLSTDLEPTQSPRRETFLVDKKGGEPTRVLFQCQVDDYSTHAVATDSTTVGEEVRMVCGDMFNSTVIASGLDMQHALLHRLPLSTISKKKPKSVKFRTEEELSELLKEGVDVNGDADGTIIGYLSGGQDSGERTYSAVKEPPMVKESQIWHIPLGTESTSTSVHQKTQNMLQLSSNRNVNDENAVPTPRAPRPLSKNRAQRGRKPSPLPYNVAHQSRIEGLPVEDWEREQQRGLTQWLNVVLKKANWSQNADDNSWKQVGASVIASLSKGGKRDVTVSPNVGKETRSLRFYSQLHNMNILRRRARVFYNQHVMLFNEPIVNAIISGKISMHPEKKVHADAGIKKSVLRLLMGVNPLWLRLALEVVFGVVIDVGDPPSALPLAHFIATNLLVDPMLSAQYGHADVRSVMMSKEGDIAQGRLFLRRILLLFIFLDKAKADKLIPSDPCLFRVNADPECKSTSEILTKLNGELLSASCGSILRTLGRIGFKPTYKQNYLNEFNYRVSNLATDLKDGIRLVKVVELMTNFDGLSCQLLFPPTSLTQMQHNVKVALEYLNKSGCDTAGIEAGNINIPNREKIFDLLWRIVFHFQIIQSVKLSELVKEVAALRGGETPSQVTYRNMIKRYGPPNYMQQPLVYLLFEWARLVARKHAVVMVDFDRSLVDGCVLQALILEYCPSLLQGPLFWDSRDTAHSVGDPGTLIQHELTRLENVFNAVKELGVPLLVRPPDVNQRMRSDPQMSILFLSLLCGRLIEVAEQRRVIIRMVTLYRQRKYIENMRIRQLKMTAAATKIQRFWKGKGKWTLYLKEWIRAARKRQQIINRIVFVQAAWRGIICRRRYVLEQEQIKLRKEEAAVLVQSQFRGFLVRRTYKAQWQAACLIQMHFRAYSLRKRVRHRFIQLKTSVIVIQSHVRRLLVHKRVTRDIACITMVQARVRGWATRKQLKMERIAVVTLQTYVRAWILGKRTRQLYLDKLKSIISVQSFARGFLTRLKFAQERECAIKLQALSRGLRVRRELLAQKQAAIIIQRRVRKWLSVRARRRRYHMCVAFQIACRRLLFRQLVKCEKGAATRIQSWFRGIIVQKRYHRLKWATEIMQTRYRAHLFMSKARAQFLEQRKAVLLLQSHTRRLLVQRRVTRDIECVTQLQAHVKGLSSRLSFIRRKEAVLTLQRYTRSWLLMKQTRHMYLFQLNCIVNVQRLVRGFLVRQSYEKQMKCIVLLQSNTRAMIVRKRLAKTRAAILLVQRRWRQKLMRIRFERTRKWIVALQGLSRGVLVRHDLSCRVKAVTLVQSVWRRGLVRRLLTQQNLAASLIQSHYRAYALGNATKQEYCHLKKWVTHLQSLGRGLLVRKEYNDTLRRLKTLQAAAKGLIVRQNVTKATQAAIIIQSFCRRRVVGRSRAEGRRLRLLFVSQRRAAIRIQAFYRAYAARKKFLRKSPIKKTRQQISERLPLLPRLAAPENTIRGRLNAAIEVIEAQRKVNHFRLTILWRSFMDVELACRITPESCAWLIEHDSFIECMYHIINCSNLSPAWIDVIHAIIKVLRNLAVSRVPGASDRLTRSTTWSYYFKQHIQSLCNHTELFIDICVFLSALHTTEHVFEEMRCEQFCYALNQSRNFIMKSRTFKDKNTAYKVATTQGNSVASKVQRITKMHRAYKLKKIESDVLQGNPIAFRPAWCLNRKLPTSADLDSQQNAFNYIVRLYIIKLVQPIL